MYEEGTTLFRLLEQGKIQEIDDELSLKMYDTLVNTLTDAGYVNQAKAAARKAKFSAKEDAPEVQTGTITYDFRTN